MTFWYVIYISEKQKKDLGGRFGPPTPPTLFFLFFYFLFFLKKLLKKKRGFGGFIPQGFAFDFVFDFLPEGHHVLGSFLIVWVEFEVRRMASNKMIVKNDGKTLTIQLPSVFTFSQHQAFREAYQKYLQAINHYIIDLVHVELLDSSALGILLVFYKTAKGINEKATFSLIHSKPQVRQILEMAHFQEMFRVL